MQHTKRSAALRYLGTAALHLRRRRRSGGCRATSRHRSTSAITRLCWCSHVSACARAAFRHVPCRPDWREGTLCVRSKDRREAMIDYATPVRPPPASRSFCGLSCRNGRWRAQPSSMVKLALVKAGIDNAPSPRHQLSCQHARAGTTLDMIGTVLRHRSIDRYDCPLCEGGQHTAPDRLPRQGVRSC